MKLISEDLVNDIQVVIDNAIHSKHTWAQIAEVKRALMGLKDAPKPRKRKPKAKAVTDDAEQVLIGE